MLPQFQPAHGNYPEMFVQLVSRVAPGMRFRHYNVENHEYPRQPGECDGYIITGSRMSVYDDAPWIRELGEFIVRLHETKTRTVGVCFGHQLIAHCLGGKTEVSSWGVGIHESDIVRNAAFMDPPLRRLRLIVSHKDQVTALPKGAEVLASSDFCPIGMFQLGGHMLGIQGHPEFGKQYSEDLMDYRRDLLGEEKLMTGIASLAKKPDAQLVGQWMVNFLRGAP